LLTTTINQQKTDVPLLEQEIISKVASYGKQLGRLIEAVNVLAKHPDESIPIAERKPLDELVELAAEITTAREEFTRDHVEEILASIKVLGRPDHVDHKALQKIRQLVDELDTPGP